MEILKYQDGNSAMNLRGKAFSDGCDEFTTQRLDLHNSAGLGLSCRSRLDMSCGSSVNFGPILIPRKSTLESFTQGNEAGSSIGSVLAENWAHLRTGLRYDNSPRISEVLHHGGTWPAESRDDGKPTRCYPLWVRASTL